jgi:hypothetical protein
MNPFFAPKWIREKVRAAGENATGFEGREDPRDGGIPSIQSPVFKEIQDEIIRRATEFVNQRDTSRAVTYYHPGAEWWFLTCYRYNHLDIADFRKWLAKRHGTIRDLNVAWDSAYSSFNEIDAPGIDCMGRSKSDLNMVIPIYNTGVDCSWCTGSASDAVFSSPVVTPGTTYTFSAAMKCDNLSVPGAQLNILWADADKGEPIYGASAQGFPVYGTTDWQRVSVTGTAPGGCGRAILQMSTAAAGTVSLKDPEFTEGSAEGSAIDGWYFRNSSQSSDLQGIENGVLQISSPPISQTAKNCSVGSVNDWAEYWYETAAEYINYCAGLFKKHDPSRKTATYLTFAFAFPAEWDYTQWTAISPDEVAMRGANIDEIGLQICAADGDPYRITANLDLVRKYDKPMWAVDLIDFTSGVKIGRDMLDEITQATVQHGAKGLIYCSWHMPTVLDYSYYPYLTSEEQNRMLTNARTAVKLMENLRIAPKIALIEPILPAAPSDRSGFKNRFRSFMGWYKILENLHHTIDIVTLREIEKGADLSQYESIVVPDCAYIPRRALERIGRYASNGGDLITSGRFAEFDEYARPLISSIGAMLPDFGALYTSNIIRDTHAGNTPPLFLWRDETAETIAVFHEARNKLESLGVTSNIELTPDTTDIRAVVYEGDDSQAIYLVNMNEKPVNAGERELRFAFPCATGVRAYADTVPVKCLFLTVGDDVWVELPAFETSCILVASRESGES